MYISLIKKLFGGDNMLKKVLMSAVAFLLILGCVSILESPTAIKISAYEADDVIEYEHIPVKMQPCSIIEFIDDTHFVILQGGLAEDEAEYSRDGMPKPKTGLVVTYADDGFILDTDFPESVLNPYDDIESEEYSVMPYYAILPGYDLVARWGAHNNLLYQSESGTNMYGTGRATTFNDAVGCYDNTLKKGDVAVKLSYDNCPNGGTVVVTAKSSSGSYITKNMIMGDHGDMPDAIVDIWKTGVEYWGYTYSTYLSLPGTTTITYTGTRRFTPIGD